MSATHLRGVKPQAKPASDPIKRKPKAPDHLSVFALKEWDRVMPMLIAKELISTADLGFVESYCMARGLIVETEARRRQAAKAEDAKAMASLLRLQNQAMLTAARLSSSLGLDPSSRARLLDTKDDFDDTPNPLDI